MAVAPIVTGGSSGGSDNSGAGDHVRPLLSSSFYEYA